MNKISNFELSVAWETHLAGFLIMIGWNLIAMCFGIFIRFESMTYFVQKPWVGATALTISTVKLQ